MLSSRTQSRTNFPIFPKNKILRCSLDRRCCSLPGYRIYIYTRDYAYAKENKDSRSWERPGEAATTFGSMIVVRLIKYIFKWTRLSHECKDPIVNSIRNVLTEHCTSNDCPYTKKGRGGKGRTEFTRARYISSFLSFSLPELFSFSGSIVCDSLSFSVPV